MFTRLVSASVVAAVLLAVPVLAKAPCCPSEKPAGCSAEKKAGCGMEKKPGCEMGDKKGFGHHGGMEALGLTDQQKQQLKELRAGMRDARMGQMEKLKALREKTREELIKPSSSMGVLEGYAKEAAALHQEMAMQESEHLLKVKSVLTQEQYGKMMSKEFWVEMCGMRPGMGPEMGPGGPGCAMKPGEGCPPDCPQLKDTGKRKAGCPMHK